MKKILNITALVLCVAFVIGMGVSLLADASVNQVSPNQYRRYNTGPNEYMGFIQIQPSYNDNGHHAQMGEVWLTSSTNPAQRHAKTLAGTHEGDSRLLDAYTDVLLVNPDAYGNCPKPPLHYKVIWQPHTGDPTRPWAHPYSFSPIENLIEPQLAK